MNTWNMRDGEQMLHLILSCELHYFNNGICQYLKQLVDTELANSYVER